jgi:hypothetical protein
VSEKSLRAALEKLAKWRKFFASWQLGTTTADDGRYRAVADHRELSILMRAEMSAVTGLLIRKGVFTQEEFGEALERSAKQLDHDYEESYPGWRSLPEGLSMKLPEALETMQKLGFPP